eukprot:TRINITY_DN3311_c0_g1_i1.p1 TRINITY_DN3311_c0_g1~~TRINITY_DN3311_c0_g1_i1.p1  ORF type:complete len:512 (+),score=136.11 TRINITY_DN3311_c0_g1_i1:3-1538(+)
MSQAPTLHFVPNLDSSSDFDALVVVLSVADLAEDFPGKDVAALAKTVDKKVGASLTIHHAPSVPGSRLVICYTGLLTRDVDDVRRYAEAVKPAIARANAAGAIAPLIYFPSKPTDSSYEKLVEVSLLAAYQDLYVNLQGREFNPSLETVQKLGFNAPWINQETGDNIATVVSAIEKGKRLGRDLGGPDPERMAPPKFAEYVKNAFENVPGVKLSIIEDQEVLRKEYPLLHSVARADNLVPRHHARVVRIEYTGEGEIEQTLLLAGKGVTYDCGGVDVKVGGSMHGMSRDKCGAANVAGFVLTTALLKTKNVKVIAELGVVRNSVGADSFVSDEIIVGHSGVRVRIVNTDAEGRLVLADCLSHLLIDAKQSPNPKMFSMATLTGHAVNAWGPYTALVENGPSKKLGLSRSIQEVGESWGDAFEVSSYRREDVLPGDVTHDVVQHMAGKPRGHQFAAGFLMIASGIAKHGRESTQPIPYVHLDIAPSATENMDNVNGKPTGCTVAALTAKFLL